MSDPAIDSHPLVKEIVNTFQMDEGRHLSTDPLVHFIKRQMRRAIDAHGWDAGLLVKGTYPRGDERTPNLMLTYTCRLVDGELEVVRSSHQVAGFRAETDVAQLVLEFEIPSTGGIQPIIDDLTLLRYR
jgi:hypothetical protein